ncbi:hypothetical protein HID58_078781 [Brassica napus]|uniref:HTH myb-type domain-containing protein n=1 Tax=Brassica napus TaxID=3708 RepID=A0ABQ7YUZ2_BRANA|nr:hypothetical protein HID58_078781 [Brassica napus]
MVQTDTDRRMGLNLNISHYSLAKPLSQFLNDVSKIKDNHSKLFEIDGYVGKLEEERKKIDVFKRELPLCMLLMNEAIERLKQEASSVQGVELETDNKKNWMSSAQLWISNTNSQFQSTNEEEDRCVTHNNANQRGAILSFNVPPPPPPTAPLSLPTSEILTDYSSRIEQSHPIQKKDVRRKWSEDLHRRFVDALQKIGGSQVATPKQIRDIMKVDGLTNDEIKSHLQKYRMHIRKHPLHPAKILIASDQHGLLDRETQNLDSPQGPLVDRGCWFSNNGGHSSEEEEKSDGRSWRSGSRRKRQGPCRIIGFKHNQSQELYAVELETGVFVVGERRMREIVTIQVGEFANFVGSHFWNFQGVSTYTPRLLSINFKGSLGSMSSHGTLYNQASSSRSDSSQTWFGDVDTQRSEPRKRNLFQQSLYEEEATATEIEDKDIVGSLDETVECWTDFSKSHYHPQSLYELNGLWMDSHDFNNYGAGKDLFSEASRGDEICDKLRFFVEECDHIQGVNFLVDDSGGFSPLAGDFLETMADDYTNVPVLLYSLRSPVSQKKTVINKLHDAVSFSRLSSFCKLFTPIGLPSLTGMKYLSLGDEKPYRSSAVYAAALHSSTLPFRMQHTSSDSSEVSNAMDVNTLVQLLTNRGRQNIVAILDSAMPLEKTLLTNLQTLTPEVTEDVEDNQSVESMCILGALGSEDQEATVSEVRNAVDASYDEQRPLFCNLSVSRVPLPVPLPFPSIFGNLVGRKGEILSSPASDLMCRGSLDVHSVPVATRWRSSSAVLPFLESRMVNLEKLGIQWGAVGSDVVRAWGFGREELQEMRENLAKMVSELSPHQFSESEDSD